MRKPVFALAALVALALAGDSLPEPRAKGPLSLEETLARRRSVRVFEKTPLTQAEIGQLLWAAQGMTGSRGERTAPSAGALYPLEFYLATADGFFHYQPLGHRLEKRRDEDLREKAYDHALRQGAIRSAPAVIVVAAIYERTAKKYGEKRSPRYVHLEAGHAAQNILLQAVALGLGAVPIGAFHDDPLRKSLGLPPDHRPLYLIPVGRPQA
ncbi:MAG: SagB/ThcOx family dehydrogenase [Planctomycetota bacterium]|jgi:SagB-type dehydrogenase family enzyme